MRLDASRNHDALVGAAIAAAHANGLTAPMADIAAAAGLSVATLYRHFASREALREYLTHRSFDLLLADAVAAEAESATGAETIRLFLTAVIGQRNELVLPLHGGPAVTATATRVVQSQVWRAIAGMIDRGRADGSIKRDVATGDVVALGATLAQPRNHDVARWDATCRRLLDTYVAGLRAPSPS